MKSVREKNKEQDFRDLEGAVRLMQDCLRSDESHPDLFDQFSFRTDIGGCHRYYLEPYKSTFGSMLEKGPFIPFPPAMIQSYERVECASFMGIIPEINRVWMTVDNVLYLWNYYQPEDFQVYDGISEVIVSVALTVPRPGIFLDTVKYLLVVATPVDIVLLAICADEAFDQVKIVPTAYTLPSDNVTMIKIVGSELGRVFMIGNDKNLYELEYTISESAWAPILGTGPQRKCRKINHFAWNWKLNNLLPPFLRSQRDVTDEFTDIVVDNFRNIVYSITRGGELNGFYLYQNTTAANASTSTTTNSTAGHGDMDFFLNSFSLFDECRRYCTSSRFAPQSSPHASVFNDLFAADSLTPIAMYPLSLTESRKAHLLIVLKNGIRIYLSLLNYRYGISGDHSPRGIEVSYIRNPPSAEVLDLAGNPTIQSNADVENGSLPSLNANRPLALGKTFASKGIFLFALEKSQQPDELFGCFEDAIRRDQSVTTAATSSTATTTPSYQSSQSYSFKEGVSLALGSNISGAKVYDVKEVTSKYYNYSYTKLKSLYYQSASPSDMNIRDQSHHHYPLLPGRGGSAGSGGPSWFTSLLGGGREESNDDNLKETQAILSDCNTLMLRSIATKAGVERQDAENLTMINELCNQHLPTHSYCTQRQFLVLTSNGLQILLKLRPADILFRCLIQHDSRTDEYVREFFMNYGSLPSSVMCLGLAVGLPVDACGSNFTNPIQSLEFTPTVPLKTIQVRAMRAMMALNPGPSFRTSALPGVASTSTIPVVGGGSNTTIQDNRVVVLGNMHEFNKSISHDAFYWLASRLLRPIWFRAIFDPRTEQLLSDVWSLFLLEEVRKPIEYLVELLVTYYPNAILANPTTTAASSSNANAAQAAKYLEGLEGTNNFITQQIADHVRQQHPNPEKTLFLQAKQLEDASIRNLYLLLTRSLQALTIIEIFLKTIEEWKLPSTIIKSVTAALRGYSFRSIVLLPSIQELCKKQLMNILHYLLSTAGKSELSEIILSRLKTSAFYYFSAGDIYLLEAKKLMNIIKSQHLVPDYQGYFTMSSSSSKEMQRMIEQCCEYCLAASEFWNSMDTIQNTNESELKQTCNALLALGKVGWETIVQICLSTASRFSLDSNDVYQLSSKMYSKHHQLFSPSATATTEGAVMALGDSQSNATAAATALMKDYHLFHGGQYLSEAMKQDYQHHCYEILIDAILFTEKNVRAVYDFQDYQKLPNQFIRQISQFLLTYSLEKCRDRQYHELLYTKLYLMSDQAAAASSAQPQRSRHEQLLSINSPFIEDFLRERNPELLYIYYMTTEYPNRAPDYLKAIDLMCGIASDPNDLLIGQRMECLEKALASAELAYQTLKQQTNGTAGGVTPSKLVFPVGSNHPSLESYLLDNIQQLTDMIAVARYQDRIGQSLVEDYERYNIDDDATGTGTAARYDEKTLRELSTMKDFIHQLQYQLVNLTTLYEIAFRYRMWDYNLLILQLSKQIDGELIQKLWKSYIYRLVPLKAKYPEVVQFLENQRRDTNKLIFDSRNQETKAHFEDYPTWLPQLFQQILTLGKELLVIENKALAGGSVSISNDPTVMTQPTPSFLRENSQYFPILMIIEEMEEILSYIRIPSIASTSVGSYSSLSTTGAIEEKRDSSAVVPLQLLQEFRQHFSFGYQLIHHLHLSSSVVIEYYLQIFLRWKSKTYDKLLQLLMIIIYLLLEWIRTTSEEVNNNKHTEDNWYCITMIRQGKFDKWLEILRAQLLSIQYRQIKESFSPFIEQLMSEMNQIQKYKENLTVYTKFTK